MGKLKLHHTILLGMLLGAALGAPLNLLAAREYIDPAWPQRAALGGEQLGTIFLRLLQMLVVPLIASSLVAGISGMGNVRDVGKLGTRALAYYLLSSALAIVTGLSVVNLLQPGWGADLAALQREAPIATELSAPPEGVGRMLWQQLLRLIPTNPIQAAAEGDMLGLIFFSLLFGVFLNATATPAARKLPQIARGVFEVMMRMTLFVIRLAPIGVFGFMLHATASMGIEVFLPLAHYMLAVIVALVFHALVVLPLLLWALARRRPWELARAVSPALLTAFATASSNATLPLTMRCVEERGRVPARVSSFVLPLGATLNMDGTALYEVVAVFFIAQALGVDLSLGQQAVVAVTALLASIGAAGIPHAGTVMMVVVLAAVGLPVTAVGLLLAVDRVLDMLRTSVNVWSDATAAAILTRLDPGELPATSPASDGDTPAIG